MSDIDAAHQEPEPKGPEQAEPGAEQPAPAFSVVRGNPTDEELAAVWVVLASRPAAAPSGPARPESSGWSAYWRAVGAPLAPGPSAWRASARS